MFSPSAAHTRYYSYVVPDSTACVAVISRTSSTIPALPTQRRGESCESTSPVNYCSLQVGCHSQWFMLDSVVSTVDTVWLTLAIHGFSALCNRYHVSLIAHALILVRYHKQARAVFTVVQWLCKIASNRSSLLIASDGRYDTKTIDTTDISIPIPCIDIEY